MVDAVGQSSLFRYEGMAIIDDVVRVIADELGYKEVELDGGVLSGWVSQGHCPLSALEEAGSRVAVLLGMDRDCTLTELGGGGETVWRDVDGVDFRFGSEELKNLWERGPRDGRDEFPLVPVVEAYLEQPQVVQHSKREKARIIPGKLGMVYPGDSRSNLFSQAAYVSGGGKDQLILPGFERGDTVVPVLPLMLYDMGVAEEGLKRSSAAPLALRLFVEAILAVPMEHREGRRPRALQVPFREFLQWFYPGPRKPRPNEYWPRLLKAVEVLDSRGARMTWYDNEMRRGGTRRVVSVLDLPRGPDCLDDEVRIVVDLPPGSEGGPQVSDRLRFYGGRSAVAYRVLLHLAYRWHHPGKTLVPVRQRGSKRKRYVWSYDVDRYDRIGDDELVSMAFPTSGNRNRRQLLKQARHWVDVLEKDGELQIVEGRILPPKKEKRPVMEEAELVGA